MHLSAELPDRIAQAIADYIQDQPNPTWLGDSSPGLKGDRGRWECEEEQWGFVAIPPGDQSPVL